MQKSKWLLDRQLLSCFMTLYQLLR